ncbi:MAG: DUF1801 domain-containing protein [Bacteroidota bacterium]
MTVEDFILDREGQQQSILQYLHELLLMHPEIDAKISYRIPFYYRKSWICYLNPLKKDGVEMVFTRGNELSNTQGILQSKGRKQVAGIELSSVEEIPTESILEIIQEALLLDEEVPYKHPKHKK